MDAKESLTFMIGFGTLLIALLTLVINIVIALMSNKRR